jgi:integrase
MKVNFYLDRRQFNQDDNPPKKLPIYLYFSFEGKRFKIYTGEQTFLKDWMPDKRRLKPTARGVVQINALLDSMEQEVLQVYRELRIMRIPVTIELLKSKLLFGKPPRHDFFSALDEFVQTQSRERDWEKTTVEKFQWLKNDLTKFSRTKSVHIEFESIDIPFFEKLSEYYLEAGRLNSTIQKKIELLKWFLNWSFKRGINRNIKYKSYQAKKKQVKNILNRLFLSWDELMRVYNLKIAGESLGRIRDVFCFGCFSGLRWSDLKRLRHSDIREGKIVLTMQKEPEMISVPLNEFAQAILKKYEDLTEFALPVISNQQMNHKLRELGALAELDEVITLVKFQGNTRIEIRKTKADLLTCHVARRTFISNGLYLGIPIQVMMKYTGQTFETIKGYYDVMEEQKVEEMKKFNLN